MSKSKLFFIINKYSGAGYKGALEGRIIAACGNLNIECAIEFTRDRGHATELAREAVGKGFQTVYAVGGDGTVNEVAQGLIHSGATMGILPKGSGNGLARHLGIPMGFTKSLAQLGSHEIISMDTILVNGRLSVNVSGIGFDGHVAGLFGKNGARGLIGYSSLVLKEFRNYREFSGQLMVDDNPITRTSFIIAFANASQFGNNARIAPHASVCDQLVDVCLIRKVPLVQVVGFMKKMFGGKLNKSSFVEIIKAKKIYVEFSEPVAYHIDGESMEPQRKFHIEVQPGSLKMCIPIKTRSRARIV